MTVSRVLIHYGKHYDAVYDASTPEAENRARAQMLIDEAEYISIGRKPEPPGDVTVTVSSDEASQAVDKILADVAQEKALYEARLRAWEKEKALYEEFQTLVAGGVDALAPRARLFWYRYLDGGEYNGIEIQDVIKP